MHDDVAELAQRGKALPAEDRSRLVDLLLESLQEASLIEVATAWDDEIERRLAAFDGGNMQSLDGENVLTRARLLAQQ